MAHTYDVIVLGVGGFGSGAFDHLARRGLKVLGLDRFPPGHDRGSSHGETRIIRKAYFEHPDYVPLLLRAYDLWHELERDSGQTLFHRAGLLISGPPEGEAVAGARLARERYDVPLEEIPRADLQTRFPGFRIPAEFDAVFEPEGGYLEVENCVLAHAERGERAGGVIRSNETVRAWSSNGRTVTVTTERDTYSAASLVITAGAWAGTLLADLRIPLQVVRKPLFWCPVRSGDYAVRSGCPTFYFDLPRGSFYGFPSIDGSTLKVAEHTGGSPVDDPLLVNREIQPDDFPRVGEFLSEHMPQIDPQPARHSVCLYTKTPDHHFAVDVHPEYRNVAVGAGFSGHGFKFTSVLGEALADLATTGRSELPIGFLSLGRPALHANRE